MLAAAVDVLSPHRAATPLPLGFTDGQLEALKWIAMALMFLDHFGRLLLGYGVDTWVFALSRAAFPLFAIVLGLNLARPGQQAARAARTARRLALWCLVAVPPSIWARGEPLLVNVLGTLALGAALCWALAASGPAWARLALALLAMVAANWVEFGLPGVLLIPAVYAWATSGRAEAGLMALLLLLVTGWLNALFGGWPALLGTGASLAIAGTARQLPVRVPRYKLAFYLVYPLHLALIGALRAL